MNILGFDQATLTGWAVAEDDPEKFTPDAVKYGHFKAPKRPLDSERLAIISRGVRELIERFEPGLVVIEQPFFPWSGTGGAEKPPEPVEDTWPTNEPPKRKTKWQFNLVTVKWLQMVKGVVLAVCGETSTPFEEYPPQSWRLTFVRRGFAPDGADDDWMKREVMRVAKQRGFEPSIQDEAEAIGILAHAIYGPPGRKRRQGDLFAMTETL